MSDPRTIREANLQSEGFRRSTDERISTLQKMIWGVITMMGTLGIGAAGIYIQIGDLKTDLAVLKTNVANVGDRLTKIEGGNNEIRTDQRQVLTTLGRIENRQQRDTGGGVVAGLYLTEIQAENIRRFLNTPARTDTRANFHVGLQLPDGVAKPLPDDLVAKIAPQLKGANYAIDSNNAIALTLPGTNVIFAII